MFLLRECVKLVDCKKIVLDFKQLRWPSGMSAVHSGLIPSRVKPMTLKLVFTAFLLDAQH